MWKKRPSTAGWTIALAAPNHGLPGLFQSNHASNTSEGVAGIVRMTVNSMVFP
jgi:hypothetical protein